MVTEFDFDGYKGFVMDNGTVKVELIELGASVHALEFAGRNIVLGYDSAEKYMNSGSCIGAIVGRYANRIGGAKFSVNGTEYRLAANDGENILHSGIEGLPLNKRRWHGEALVGDAVRFTILSPDGDNGFPGNNEIRVTYALDNNSMRIEICGTTDKDTAFGPATHTYFNLTGEKDTRNTRMQIFAHKLAEVGEDKIPTGKLNPAEGEYNFRTMRPIENSYDHCFLLDGRKAFTAEAGGIRLSMATDYPGLQLYTGDYLDEGYGPCEGFAVEPQFLPDSPNKPEFPFEFLRAGETMKKHVVYTFTKTE